MQFQENYSLRPHNTFGIDARARYFAAFTSVEQLEELADFAYSGQKANPSLVLGGGSNILLTGDVDGWVFHNRIGGIKKQSENEKQVFVTAGAGEVWHQVVQHCLAQNWGGIENLSLIPGSAGAAPMQNIGAYGVELKDCFHSLQAWHTGEKKLVEFNAADCQFGYRESVFKKKLKGQFIITSVTLRLQKQPVLNTSYGAIQQELDKMNPQQTDIRAISEAVIRIRRSKLPDPMVLGNAGSFFKNPSVSAEKYQSLKNNFPALVAYPNSDGSMKLAAGWLIEHCGWKGYREGDAGCHKQQALVLINYGHATGKEIYNLSGKILKSVYEKFGVELEREVNVI